MKKNKELVLVAVESPAKSRTLQKMLPKNYVVKASFGHIMELPKSKLGFDPEKDFEPEYVVSRDKTKVVKELKSYLGPYTKVILASDDDREGEVIAWTLCKVLKLDPKTTDRIVFHEITKKAVMHALENPGRLNMDTVNAGIARRVLDRAVGYILSPLLWKKIKYGLSAGRVQSAALRIVSDKELEIKAFDPQEFWKIKLDVNHGTKFVADLNKIDGKTSKVSNKVEADTILNDCKGNGYVLSDVIEKDGTRNPPPPFTTSTLQQVASSKAGLSVKNTMSLAQRLYEGSIRVPGHEGGLITYMRTDSTNLSTDATTAAKQVIINEYGAEYANPYIRTYGKSKGAQEAHEAIRPTNMKLKPSDIEKYLDKREFKLYSLIWSRTMATQMAQAKTANTTYKITGGSKKQYEFIAKGTKILFKGFLKAYDVGGDTEYSGNKDEKILPTIAKGSNLDNSIISGTQEFTKPPARYSEASLVKKLETEGIGRPSTYASTISTIVDRGYVIHNKEKRLEPTLIGTTVSEYLKENFKKIIDLKFTANIESEFDKVSDGKIKWSEIMHSFYDGFVKDVESKQDGERVQFSQSRLLGKHKETGLDMFVKTSTFGSYIQVGEGNKETKKKPYKTSPIPKGISPEEITMDNVDYYLRVPRVLGTKDDKDVKVNVGRFGPYAQWNNKYYSIKKNDEYDIYTITLEQALALMKEKDDFDKKSLLWSNKDNTVNVIQGRFSMYVNDKRNPKKTINQKIIVPDNFVFSDKLTENDVLSYTVKKGNKNGSARKRSN